MPDNSKRDMWVGILFILFVVGALANACFPSLSAGPRHKECAHVADKDACNRAIDITGN